MALRILRGITTTLPTTNNPFEEVLRELDAEADAKVHVFVESRRYGKAVTIVDGIEGRTDLPDILKALKQQLATGGSAKNGVIELQGDHRRRAAAILAAMTDLGLRHNFKDSSMKRPATKSEKSA